MSEHSINLDHRTNLQNTSNLDIYISRSVHQGSYRFRAGSQYEQEEYLLLEHGTLDGTYVGSRREKIFLKKATSTT
jgi:hypothetical protein